MKFWIHTDPNLQEACANGLQRALSGDWTSGTAAQRVRDFRGFVVYHAWVVNEFGGTEILGTSGASATARIEPAMSADPERARVQKAFLTAALLLARGAGMPEGYFLPDQITTGPVPEVGIIPAVAAIAMGLAEVAEWAAIAWLGVNAAQVVDNYLSRDQRGKDFARDDATALRALELHAESEQKAGHPEPLNDAEKQILDMLEEREAAFAKIVTPSIDPNPFRGAGGAAEPFSWGFLAGAAGVIGAGFALNHFFSRAA